MKLRSLIFIFAIIAFVSGTYRSIPAGRQRARNPEKIEATVVSKNVYCEQDVSFNTTHYYIDLEYEVKNENPTAATSAQVETSVYDKSGELLGTVTSNLDLYGSSDGTNLKKGDKVTIKSTLEETRPEENAFFTILYNEDFSNLRFECKTTSAGFEN